MARPSDTELVRRIRATDRPDGGGHGGPQDAFAALADRHRRALLAYARRLLRDRHAAEDVVQDALLAAHRALTEGTEVREPKAWLHRLVRNRAIDEVRRARHGDAALAEEMPDGGAGDPVAVLTRRETVRRLVEDLSDLPEQQRAALLLRELEGAGPDEVAEELGVSRAAGEMLVARARGALVRTRDARDADCEDVRFQLAAAHERGVRASAHATRHAKDCPACRGYRRDLRRVDRRLRALLPPVWVAPLALAAKLGGGSAGKAAAGASVAVVAAAGAGLVVLDTDDVGPGEASPFRLTAVGPYIEESVERGTPLPEDVSVSYAKVEIPAGAPTGGDRRSRSVALACPGGGTIVGIARPQREIGLGYGFDRTITRLTTRVRVVFDDRTLPQPVRTRIGVVCKRPDASGTVVEDPRRTQAGEEAATVCAESTYLYLRPGRTFRGTVVAGEPLSLLRRSASGTWSRVVNEVGTAGWVRSDALCAPGETPRVSGRP